MSYLNGYGLNKLTDTFDRILDTLERVKELRRKHAHDIPKRAKEAHQEVLDKINQFIPGDNIERKVLCSHFIPGSGCLVELEDGKSHILLNYDIASFDSSNGTYQAFKESNPEKKVTPKDFLMNVVAHEYGHILFEERIESKLRQNLFYSLKSLHFSIPSEFDEAFAFSFADNVTEFKSPLNGFAFTYERNGLDFDKTIQAYNDLNQLLKNEGTDAIFNHGNIREILSKYFKQDSKVFEEKNISGPIIDGLKESYFNQYFSERKH